jgi:hypothetical protein
MTRRIIHIRLHLSNHVVIFVRGEGQRSFMSLPDINQAIFQILFLRNGNLKEIVVGSLIKPRGHVQLVIDFYDDKKQYKLQ